MGLIGDWLGLGDPMRSGGEYEGIDRENFKVPGYDQQQSRLSGYLGGVDNRGAPQIGDFRTANQSSFRGNQGQLADMLMQRAQGKNSVAELQAQQGMDAANAQQRSFMAGARPSNAAMAMRLGQQGMANSAMGIQGQAAVARANEALQASGMLGSVLAQGRGADEQLAMWNAGQQNQRTGQQAQMNQQQMALDDAARAGLLGQSIGLAGMEQQGGMNYEGNRTQRYAAALGVPTKREAIIGGISGLAGGLLGGG